MSVRPKCINATRLTLEVRCLGAMRHLDLSPFPYTPQQYKGETATAVHQRSPCVLQCRASLLLLEHKKDLIGQQVPFLFVERETRSTKQ